MLRSLIVNGLIAGVGVLVFIPQIFVLFACITILEDSGYMSRAALVTDRIMEIGSQWQALYSVDHWFWLQRYWHHGGPNNRTT